MSNRKKIDRRENGRERILIFLDATANEVRWKVRNVDHNLSNSERHVLLHLANIIERTAKSIDDSRDGSGEDVVISSNAQFPKHG